MADVVNYVVKIIERNLLPKYPSIDGVVIEPPLRLWHSD